MLSVLDIEEKRFTPTEAHHATVIKPRMPIIDPITVEGVIHIQIRIEKKLYVLTCR
jgi:hypothetical protein